jgi:hypothetical protein
MNSVLRRHFGTLGQRFCLRGLECLLIVLLGIVSSHVLRADAILVADAGTGTVGEYTTSGATINAALISGLMSPNALAASDSTVFVSSSGAVGEYTASGATVNAKLIPTYLTAMATSGANLFGIMPSIHSLALIKEFTISYGAAIQTLSQFGGPGGIAVSDSMLFVANPTFGTISEYTTSLEPDLCTRQACRTAGAFG